MIVMRQLQVSFQDIKLNNSGDNSDCFYCGWHAVLSGEV